MTSTFVALPATQCLLGCHIQIALHYLMYFSSVSWVWKSLYKLLLQLFSTFICQKKEKSIQSTSRLQGCYKRSIVCTYSIHGFLKLRTQWCNINFRKVIFNCQAGPRTIWNMIWGPPSISITHRSSPLLRQVLDLMFSLKALSFSVGCLFLIPVSNCV